MIRHFLISASILILVTTSCAFAGPTLIGQAGTGNWSNTALWGGIGGIGFPGFPAYPGDTNFLSFNYPQWDITLDPGADMTLDVSLGGTSPVRLTVDAGATLTNSFNGTTTLSKMPLFQNEGLVNYGTVNVGIGNLNAFSTAFDNSLLNHVGGVVALTGTGTLTFNQQFENDGMLTLGGANTHVIGGPYGSNIPFPAFLLNTGTIEGGGSLGTPGGRISMQNNGVIDVNGSDPLVLWTDGQLSYPFPQNTGTVTVEVGSVLDIESGGYLQTAGLTKVKGTLTSTGLVDIEGGKLGGQDIQANVLIGGTGILAPGDPQTTTIGGTFTMTGGSIYLEILGLNAIDQDHVIFNGSADLSGGVVELNIPLGLDLNGLSLDLFTFNGGQTGHDPIFTFTNGQNYHVVEQSGSFVFSGNTVFSGPTAPEPATFGMLTGALGLLLMTARRRRKA